MKISEIFAPTLREVPAEAEVISHILMLRAGMIRKAASGVYTFLPLGYRVMKKVIQIVREEMDKKGGQELMLPIIQPAELWMESGRWHVYGDELFRLKDRHGRDFALGPTHEEIITDLVKGDVRSYKQLPLLLYQIQNKYRDERRPRFGLMRGREFIMKDLYSFDRDQEGLDVSYQKMYDAYARIFTRCGLQFRPVEADPGAIGGSGGTHEFMVVADSGEAAIVYCDTCNYAANVEKAEAVPDSGNIAEEMKEMQEISTPGARTIDEVTGFLKVNSESLVKTLIYQTEAETIAAIVRGDREINEIKLQNLLGSLHLEMADERTVREITGAAPGFAGPVGLSEIRIIADSEVMQMRNTITGANKTDTHIINVNPGRDFVPERIADIRLVKAGEKCPRCEGILLEARGIEVGQVFKLGTKYSEAMGARYLDENGREKLMVMGCYGVGVSRTVAASIEQNHDQDGIIWPMPIAPFHAVVVPVSFKDEQQLKLAQQIYNSLNDSGVEAVIDDRNERPGVKFKDADLIGFPLRVIVGTKAVEEGTVEIKHRRTGDVRTVAVTNAVSVIRKIVSDELAESMPSS
ncbi:proline--tRNA ligase [Phosphitispora fastidiosa]|uniref:proline--tRNA ligase n=1 Tax=Phosphitispora fastidiosa TaxID=2837202 RepID=UPI001E63C041|nr:proline--tRNA ligase [Phosphitispora fastidiosa]MBU7008311.1 prolyl-tRNA synthetase [Phosphitispora fastidiosa]